MPSFAIQNFGCRVNQAEAFSWSEELARGGLSPERNPARADFVVINTCTLTAGADRDVRKFIRRVSRINPSARLVIAGCSVDGGAIPREGLPTGSVLLPNRDKAELSGRILSFIDIREKKPARPLRSRALLKIQDGCDLGCTFCVVPSVRGPSRSIPQEEILDRARRFVALGFREIVLCGIHLSSYGLDQNPRGSLAGLIDKLVGLDGLGRIRLSSLDPRRLDDRFLSLITGHPRICPHFHLSLQHASDRILKIMGRGSTAAGYEQTLGRLRKRAPEAALGADLIVGFPGEDDEDFERLRDFVERSPLDYLHVFTYSPRPNTPAAALPQVPEAEKRRRSAHLRAIGGARRASFRRRFLDRELEAVVIRKDPRSAEVLTSNYIDVEIAGCSAEPGGAVRVKITELRSGRALGKEAL